MTYMISKKIGFSPITSLTFSENDYLDQKIALQIADDYNFESIFFSLNGGRCMLNFDQIVSVNEGLSNYFGAAHLYNTTKK